MPVIRPAAASEVGAVSTCVRAAFQPYVVRCGRTPAPMGADHAALIAARAVLVAEEAGSVVGVLVLKTTDTGLLVETIAVRPEHQGRGVGRRLLDRAETEARRAGVATIHLYTHEKMTEAQALYRRLGYREYARRTEDGYPRVYLRKRSDKQQ